MKRKILDVTVLCMFCICLIVTANIEEKSAKRTCESGQTGTNESAMTDENAAPVAGVCRTLSGYSFTTESDEKTEISKKQTTLVATSENKDSDEEVAEQDRKDEKEAEENQAVLAGLAEPVSMTAEAEGNSAGSAEPVSMTAEAEENSAVSAGLAEPVSVTAEAMSSATAIKNRWDITLTQEEIDLLAKIVWLESRGEPVEGQEAVVEVVFNRMTSGKYPTTVYEVLSQGNPVQFCSWKNRDRAEPTEKEYQSIRNVLDGKTSILRNDTLYFSTEPLTSRIDRQIGGHSFCY